MEVSASVKVPEGKMVKLGAEIDDGKVKNAEIRGDFFLQPPGKLQELEEKLEGIRTDQGLKEIEERLETVDAELIGFSHRDIAKALRKAIRGDEE